MLSAAKVLAMTALDLFTDSETMKKVTEEFQAAKSRKK